MQISSDSLGAYLREEREQQNVSLQNISAATKIQIKFLQALEDDEYDHLPPSPFVVGFLRAYAQFLSLDPEAIVTTYQRRYRTAEPLHSPTVHLPNSDRPAKRLGFAGLSAVVVVVGIFLLLVLREFRSNRDIDTEMPVSPTTSEQTSHVQIPSHLTVPMTPALPASETVQSAPPILPAPAPALTPPPSQPQEPQTVSDRPTAPQPLATAALPATPSRPDPPRLVTPPPLILQVQAIEKTWIRVNIDGQTSQALLLETGKNIRWEATEHFTLTVGNAKGTTLLLNDRKIPLPPAQNNVVRNFLLTRDLLN